MFVDLTNLKAIESIYQTYISDPERIDPTWRAFFDGLELIGETTSKDLEKQTNVLKLINTYRVHGFKFVNNNPLIINNKILNWREFGLSNADLNSIFYTDLLSENKKSTLKEIINSAATIYCDRIGFDFEHCGDSLRNWIKEKIEKSFTLELDLTLKHEIFEALNKADIFESFLSTKYPGQARFSIGGAETLIPIIFAIINKGLENDLKEVVIGMPHRGRLNVLANVVQKPYSIIFYEFEESYYPFPYEGVGDVKYHKGFSSKIKKNNKIVHISLSANPSHLESIDPVILGQTYAKQILNNDLNKNKILPILIHGDASFSSQGVVYESMQLMRLENYFVGGVIHIIINNQIGYTTPSKEGKSTLNCTDIAKAFGIPVFHINAEDPESCIATVNLAMEINQKFKIDVILDLICYRKYGHNEGDEPIFTQPIEYGIIRNKKSIRNIYRDYLIKRGELDKQIAMHLEEKFIEILNAAFEEMQGYKEKAPEPEKMLGLAYPDCLNIGEEELFKKINSSIDASKLKEIVLNFSKIPENFNLHPKLRKWVNTRVECIQKDLNEACIDWSFAEMLSFSSLLDQKKSVRLAGQDSKRGTFSQRHLMWVDQKTAEKYYPLNNLANQQALFEIVNTPLSEFAALGFEYGYSLSNQNALVLWEAQFGDFYNGAQILIDQYISAAEKKWNYFSSLVLLLPHGYEGQGPEHSSARIERFLQLTASNNILVVNPTTPSQYFHLLRRQALRKLKKPLVVFTPKSLLRHPLCRSSISDLTTCVFEEILEDFAEVKNPQKIIFCSGKVFYDLLNERTKRKVTDCLIIRIEQLYPLRKDKIRAILDKHENIKAVFWVQEEPENMGAWSYIYRPLQELIKPLKLNYIGRDESTSPAVGSRRRHYEELNIFLNKVFE